LLSCYRLRVPLHSFPTRRSSDLVRRTRRQQLAVGDAVAGGDLVFEAVVEQGRVEAVAVGFVVDGQLVVAAGLRLEIRAAHHGVRSEEHTSELQSREKLVCRLLLE